MAYSLLYLRLNPKEEAKELDTREGGHGGKEVRVINNKDILKCIE